MIHAVICDVYGTLLDVGPAPADADVRWRELVGRFLPGIPAPARADFLVACRRAIAMRHDIARSQGIAFPEVIWPEVLSEALPGFTDLPCSLRNEFIDCEVRISRTTRLAPAAAAALRGFREAGCVIGIASNGQDYSRRELAGLLAGEGIALDWFDRELCFWSFEHGFSKPDPHVFRLLSVRLAMRGIQPGRILMVGDRLDNDIEPARAQGWQTWRIGGFDPGRAGDWQRLAGAGFVLAAPAERGVS